MKKHWSKFTTENLKDWIPEFDHSYVYDKYKTPMRDKYHHVLIQKNKIECDTIKKLYNKYEVKKFFEYYKLNVPTLYYYSTKNVDITHAFRDEYVAKPAHMSESDHVFINDKDYKKADLELRKALTTPPRSSEPEMMKQAERGIIVEEYIKYDYEFKVFVLYGCPILGDIRDGQKEWNRIDIIDKKNKYFNWDREYEICKQIAKDLRIDFFRIDFFYSKKDNILYAGEMAFRPSTLLGNQVENFILTKWKGMI